VNELIEYTHSHGITSHIRLWYAKYHELQQKNSILPSHYIYTACRQAASVYKSFIELRKLGMCEEGKLVFKGRTIWLDNELFKLDAESWSFLIVVHGGRWITLRLLHGSYI
jgi:putative transposase